MPRTLEEVLDQNARLVAQVKLLVRMEQRLLASQRRVEAQNARIAALNAFALAAPHCRSEVEILHRLLDLACTHLATQATLLIVSRQGGEEGATAFLRTADEPVHEVAVPAECLAALRGPRALDAALVLPAVEPGSAHAPLLSCLEALAPPSDWERTALRRTQLLLPIESERRPEGRRALLVARCAIGSSHEDLVVESDQSFLQLLCRHTASAMEIVALHADLEQRVERRTRDLAGANQRQRESLASLDEAQRELLQQMSELVRTREQLVQAEKAALAGRLAAMIAHEVNNPLAYMQANLGLLGEQASRTRALWSAASAAAAALAGAADPTAQAAARALGAALGSANELRIVEEFPELVAETRDGARRIAELVRGLSVLAGLEGRGAPEAVDVGEAVALAVGELSEGDRSAVAVEPPPASLAPAWISRNDLRVGLLSLVRFLCGPGLCPERPDRAVTVWLEEHERSPCLALRAERVHLSEKERRRIFDPRVEPPETVKGSRVQFRIELALTYQVLRRNGAELSTSDEPAGITFRIVLPCPPGGALPPVDGAGEPASSERRHLPVGRG